MTEPLPEFQLQSPTGFSWKHLIARSGYFVAGIVTSLAIIGVWQAAQDAWPSARQRIDQAITQKVWAEAISGEPASVQWPWHTVEGASGDRILEPARQPAIVVLDSVSGEALSASAVREAHLEEAAAVADGKKARQPVSLKALATGDRVNITTADGRTLKFRVAGPKIAGADVKKVEATKPAHAGKAMALIALWLDDKPGSEPVYYVIEAIAPSSDSELAPAHQL